MGRKIGDHEIENLAFYTYGRTEQDIQRVADEHGILKSDLTQRVFALFSSKAGGQVLGAEHSMPVLPANAGNTGDQSVALDDRPRNQVQKPARQLSMLGTPSRFRAVEVIREAGVPIEPKRLYDLIEEKVGLNGRSSAYNLVQRLKEAKIIRKVRGNFVWGRKAPPKGESQPEPYPRIETAPPGTIRDLIMRYMSNKHAPVDQAGLCQALKAKHPQFNPFVWNVTISSLVKSRLLHRLRDGVLTKDRKVKLGAG